MACRTPALPRNPHGVRASTKVSLNPTLWVLEVLLSMNRSISVSFTRIGSNAPKAFASFPVPTFFRAGSLQKGMRTIDPGVNLVQRQRNRRKGFALPVSSAWALLSGSPQSAQAAMTRIHA